MDIHPQKTCVIHFGYSNPRHEYFLNGMKITEVVSNKDLGVTISDSCSPSSHISEITRKVNGILSQLSRTLISRNKEVIVNLYKVFVRPIIESAGPAWSPFERQFIDELEKVQRRATRMVPGIGHMNYEERLTQCRLTSLEHRRQRGDMILVFKMLNGFTCIDSGKLFCFTSQRHDVATRSSANNCLVAEKCHLDVRKHFFTNRIVQN